MSPIVATILLDAEVTEPGDPVPAPGILHALRVDRYRVVRVLDGAYDGDRLLAAREAGPTFESGELVRLTLARHLPPDAAPMLTDVAEAAERGLLYVVEAERLGAAPVEPALGEPQGQG